MRNWKTTAAGAVIGVLNLSANGVTLKSFLLSLALAALGAFAKDHNVTGA